jgi:hypothetical protein
MSQLINDTQSLVGATSRFGHKIPVYDDGYGPLFISRDSMGISGIVRAKTWEDAYGICEDEFFPEADETVEQLVKEYGFRREHVKVIHPLKDGAIDRSVIKDSEMADYEAAGGNLREGQFVRWETRETLDPDAWPENQLFCESFGFRPNGPNATDTVKHGIYAKDLNGDWLHLLTPELIEELEIALEIKNEEEA